MGELKEGPRNNDETRYVRDCDSTEEEEEHKNNFFVMFYFVLFGAFCWLLKSLECKKMHNLRNIESILILSSYVYIGL